MNQDFKLEKLLRKNVAGMASYSSARDEFTGAKDEMVFLDANENPFESGLNRYPDPKQRDLKNRLSGLKGVPSECILLGNGSDEVLDLLFRAFCRPGKDNIISLPPTYGMYKVLANLNEVEDREVVLGSDFQPEVEEILSRVDENTKMIFLCSPNNPTGNSFSEEAVLKLLRNFNGLVIIDEAYIDFAHQKSWIQRLSEFPNLVISQTLSKAYGMAGIRLGICFASQAIVGLLDKIKPPYNINVLSQSIALERLSDTQRVEQEIEQIRTQKELLHRELAQLSLVKEIFPSEANFWLIRVDDADRRYRELLQKGVVVRNRSNQVLCENTLRVSVGTPAENQKLINALKELEI